MTILSSFLILTACCLYLRTFTLPYILYFLLIINLILAYPFRHIIVTQVGFNLRGIHEPFGLQTYLACYSIFIFAILTPLVFRIKDKSSRTLNQSCSLIQITGASQSSALTYKNNKWFLPPLLILFAFAGTYLLSAKAGVSILEIIFNPNRFRLAELSSSGFAKVLLVPPYLFIASKYTERLTRKRSLLLDPFFYIFIIFSGVFSALAYRAIATYVLVSILIFYFVLLKRSVRGLFVSLFGLFILQSLFAVFRHLAASNGADSSSSLFESMFQHSILSGWHGLDSFEYSIGNIKELSRSEYYLFWFSSLLSLFKLQDSSTLLSFSDMFNNIISNNFIFSPRPGIGGVSEYMPSFLYVLLNKSLPLALFGSYAYIVCYWYLINIFASAIQRSGLPPSPLTAVPLISISTSLVFLFNSPGTVLPSVLMLIISWLFILGFISSRNKHYWPVFKF